MTRVKALRESLKRELARVCGIRFYDYPALPIAKPPFGVCSLIWMRRKENWDEYDLLVHIADYATDEEKVEALAETAVNHLHHLDYFGDDGTDWSAYVEDFKSVDSSDKNIHLMKIVSTIKYYRKDLSL